MQNIIKQLSSIPTATIAYGQEDRGVVDSRIGPMWKPIKMIGIAYTVKSKPGDNLAVHRAISIAPPGSVIVLDVDYYKEHASLGDIIIRNCIANKFSGFVTNGVMRDLAECRSLGLPIYATGICIKGPKKNDKGIIVGKINFGGIEVNTGDYVVGDDDGLVVVKPADAESVIDLALKKEAVEEEIAIRISKGENTLEIFELNS